MTDDYRASDVDELPDIRTDPVPEEIPGEFALAGAKNSEETDQDVRAPYP